MFRHVAQAPCCTVVKQGKVECPRLILLQIVDNQLKNRQPLKKWSSLLAIMLLVWIINNGQDEIKIKCYRAGAGVRLMAEATSRPSPANGLDGLDPVHRAGNIPRHFSRLQEESSSTIHSTISKHYMLHILVFPGCAKEEGWGSN